MPGQERAAAKAPGDRDSGTYNHKPKGRQRAARNSNIALHSITHTRSGGNGRGADRKKNRKKKTQYTSCKLYGTGYKRYFQSSGAREANTFLWSLTFLIDECTIIAYATIAIAYDRTDMPRSVSSQADCSLSPQVLSPGQIGCYLINREAYFI